MSEQILATLAAYHIRPGQSLRVGLISNPGSGGNRRGLDAIKRVVAAYPDVVHREARSPADMAAALKDLGDQGLDLLIINAGDGTIAAALTSLFNDRPFSKQPLLALLRGGTTNITAGDAGMKQRPAKALKRLLSWAQSVHTDVELLERPVIRVQRAPEEDPLYGMVFGVGALVSGTEYCHEKVLSRGVRGGLGPAICTLRLLFAMLRGDTRYVAPIGIDVRIDSQDPQRAIEVSDKEFFVLMVCAVERLSVGMRPYWGPQQGPLYYTAIRANPAHPLRAIPRLLWGHVNRFATPENGYASCKLTEVELTMDGRMSLDGELYEVGHGRGPLRLSHGGNLSFIRC